MTQGVLACAVRYENAALKGMPMALCSKGFGQAETF